MLDTSGNPAVIESCTKEKLDQLMVMSASIKRCETSLNEYLEGKKKSFPRFYFLSNQSLLTILSNGTNPPKVCEFIGDCFDGLSTLVFDPPLPGQSIPKIAYGMESKDGEIVHFQEKFDCCGAVENWCTELEFQMRQILY
jgi:dynein heavy chain